MEKIIDKSGFEWELNTDDQGRSAYICKELGKKLQRSCLPLGTWLLSSLTDRYSYTNIDTVSYDLNDVLDALQKQTYAPAAEYKIAILEKRLSNLENSFYNKFLW